MFLVLDIVARNRYLILTSDNFIFSPIVSENIDSYDLEKWNKINNKKIKKINQVN